MVRSSVADGFFHAVGLVRVAFCDFGEFRARFVVKGLFSETAQSKWVPWGSMRCHAETHCATCGKALVGRLCPDFQHYFEKLAGAVLDAIAEFAWTVLSSSRGETEGYAQVVLCSSEFDIAGGFLDMLFKSL